MFRVRCHTNLDLAIAEQWPTYMPVAPNVGDLIQSAFKWTWYPRRDEGDLTEKLVSHLELEVVRVRWVYVRPAIWECSLQSNVLWVPEIELHLPKNGLFPNITAFYEWYGKITGRGKHAFI